MWSSTVAGVRDVARRDVPLVGSSPGCLVRDSKIPEPPAGHRWKEGEKDWQKYEETRHLKGVVDKIHTQYRADWKSPEMKKRQWAVALYFIDKCPLVQLALQTGNEKEEGEMADTVGCHLLRVEHIWLHIRADGREHVVELDFLGKDSISYHNRVTVEKLTSSLNKHLQDLMDRLTAKVFQTYNASITLQEQLQVLTSAEDSLTSKVLAYNRTNRAVAVLCNHQRATPKTFEKSMQRLQTKIETKKTQVSKVQVELEKGKADLRMGGDSKSKRFLQKQRQMLKLKEQLARLHTQATGREENRRVALGTAKLNYLDPRISIAWKWFSNIWPLEGPRSVTLCGRGSLEAGLSGRPCVLQTKEAKEEAS